MKVGSWANLGQASWTLMGRVSLGLLKATNS